MKCCSFCIAYKFFTTVPTTELAWEYIHCILEDNIIKIVNKQSYTGKGITFFKICILKLQLRRAMYVLICAQVAVKLKFVGAIVYYGY